MPSVKCRNPECGNQIDATGRPTYFRYCCEACAYRVGGDMGVAMYQVGQQTYESVRGYSVWAAARRNGHEG